MEQPQSSKRGLESPDSRLPPLSLHLCKDLKLEMCLNSLQDYFFIIISLGL